MACFADINVSQGSVATYARCDGIFNIHLTANLPRNLPVKVVFNRLRFDRSMVTSLWPSFFGPLCSKGNPEEVGPLIELGGLEECCKFPSGSEAEPGRPCITAQFQLKNGLM